MRTIDEWYSSAASEYSTPNFSLADRDERIVALINVIRKKDECEGLSS